MVAVKQVFYHAHQCHGDLSPRFIAAKFADKASLKNLHDAIKVKGFVRHLKRRGQHHARQPEQRRDNQEYKIRADPLHRSFHVFTSHRARLVMIHPAFQYRYVHG